MTNEAPEVPSSVPLDEIGQISLTVSDLALAKDFYRNLLGMEFLFEAGAMAFFQCGDIRLMLGTSTRPVVESGTIVYFRVPDIHAAFQALTGRGVPFVGVPHLAAAMPDHELWLCFLHDLDGNTLALMSEIANS